MTPISLYQVYERYILFRDVSTDSKKELIMRLTNNRTHNLYCLRKNEATKLIKQLTTNDPCALLRKNIYHLAYKANIIYGHTELDKNLNRIKLFLFLKDSGVVKKSVEDMTVHELRDTRRQMERIIKHNASRTDEAKAKKVASRLIKEMNLTVQKN